MATNALISHQTALPTATSATTDKEVLASWLANLRSQHTRRNFTVTAERFLEALGCRLRQATVEDVRHALEALTDGVAGSTARQYTLRVKSLLGYAHRVGYTIFNAGAVIKAPPDVRALSKRIVSELDVNDLVRSSSNERDYLLVAVAYAAGLRVSELVGLDCGDVITQDKGRVQLHVLGKGGREREVLLPKALGPLVLALCAGRPHDAPLFLSRRGKSRLTPRAVNYLMKKLTRTAGVNERMSPHWLRHAHAQHSLARGAPLPVVQETLGHANLATTSAYLRAQPGTASGDSLDPDVWLRRQ